MAQWEYSYSVESNETVLTILRDAIRQVPVSIPRKLKDLTPQGWELVAVTKRSIDVANWHLVFRRERES